MTRTLQMAGLWIFWMIVAAVSPTSSVAAVIGWVVSALFVQFYRRESSDPVAVDTVVHPPSYHPHYGPAQAQRGVARPFFVSIVSEDGRPYSDYDDHDEVPEVVRKTLRLKEKDVLPFPKQRDNLITIYDPERIIQ